MKHKVFLGGTCNESTWRETIIKDLESEGIAYFNPVVDDWTPECQEEKEHQKWDKCDIHLYVITPKMTGTFSIAEAVESTMLNTECVFCVLPEDDVLSFDKGQLRSLDAVGRLIKKHGGHIAYNLDGVIDVIKKLV